jgi:hypothetical protein
LNLVLSNFRTFFGFISLALASVNLHGSTSIKKSEGIDNKENVSEHEGKHLSLRKVTPVMYDADEETIGSRTITKGETVLEYEIRSP